ncbi:hypothetical protein PoB_003600600 [Plakobranchus ocellatus]|uniref:DUF19 domain-containing protein n=1 Tax=Plakobranchus ocellatus TaxID=259542 RepID=A0AAV4AMU1_9GAST|nr:hypothetical protein PoB_003600600 [Plakobranchus ocellatus]
MLEVLLLQFSPGLKSLPQLVRKLFQRLITAIPSQPTDMWKFLALLPCLLLVAEVKGNCLELLACEDPMDDAVSVDQLCSELSNLTSCITSRLDTCDNMTIKSDVIVNTELLAYPCSPEGRPVVYRLALSNCTQSSSFEAEKEAMMTGCLDTFGSDLQMEAQNAGNAGRELNISVLCHFIYQMKTCFIQGGTDICGADLGTFMAYYWDITIGAGFADLECAQNVVQSRRYVKRALPMLSQNLAAISKLRLKK